MSNIFDLWFWYSHSLEQGWWQKMHLCIAIQEQDRARWHHELHQRHYIIQEICMKHGWGVKEGLNTVPESTMKLSVLQPPPHPPSHGWDLVLRLFKFPPPNERFDLSPVDYSWGGKEPKDHRSHAFSLLASPLHSLRWSPAFHPLLCRLYSHAFTASCQSTYIYIYICSSHELILFPREPLGFVKPNKYMI